MEFENGLKIVKLGNWLINKDFVSKDKFCFGFEIRVAKIGEIIKGTVIFILGLKISFEAMFDI